MMRLPALDVHGTASHRLFGCLIAKNSAGVLAFSRAAGVGDASLVSATNFSRANNNGDDRISEGDASVSHKQ